MKKIAQFCKNLHRASMQMLLHAFAILFSSLSVAVCHDQVNSSCGMAVKTIGLIYGGNESQTNSWPWHVAIYQISGNEYLCGATLVASSFVVTAAHCIQYKQQALPRQSSEIVLKLGKHDLAMQYERHSINAYPSGIFLHPDWNVETLKFESDIAIVALEVAVQYSASIQPICLWKQEDGPDVSSGVVIGYGKSEAPELPNKLRELEVEILSNEDCFLKNSRLALISSKTSFCAGRDSHSGPCHGDLNL